MLFFDSPAMMLPYAAVAFAMPHALRQGYFPLLLIASYACLLI